MRYIVLMVILFHSFIRAQNTSSYVPERPDYVLVVTATGGIFDQARNELINELRDEFSLKMIEINSQTSIKHIESAFKKNSTPKAVILIGNNAIRLYVKYAHSHKIVTDPVQVITVLALDAERAVASLTNVNAIAYQTPMVTALVNFRRVISQPLTKVGVIFREPLADFVAKHMRICRDEKITVVGVEVGDDTSKHKQEISGGLYTLLKKEKVEALWIPNDDLLLKPELIGNVWYPALKKKNVPLIVGIESLVAPAINFGTFAVIPDPVALGEQAAEIVFNLKLDDWNHNGIQIHPAISMYSVLNVKKATEFFDKNELKTYEVSKLLNGKK